MNLKSIRVLIVDDEVLLLELSKIFLEKTGGIIADTAPSGNEALSMLATKQYDVIVSDYQMPGKDGLQLLREIKERGSDVPFILFTGKSREDIAVAALNMGAAFYLQKGGDPKAQFAELSNMIFRAAANQEAERRLITSEEKFRTMFMDSAEAYLLLSGKEFIDCNKAALKMYRTTLEGILGRSPADLSPPFQPDGRSSEEKMLEVLQNANAPMKFEWLHQTADGTEFYALIALTPLNPAGDGYIFCAVTDITDRKKAEQALKASEGRFRSVVANAEALSFVIDRNGIITLSEGKGLANLGRRPGELVGKSINELLSNDPHLIRSVERASKGESLHDIFNYRGRKYDTVFTPVKGEEGQSSDVIAIANDITEKALIDQERQQNAMRMQALLELNQMSDRPLSELTAFAMEEGVRLTNSSIGYLAFMNEDETVLTMHAWSREAMKQCAITEKPFEYKVSETGLWGEAVRLRKAVITNDYSAPSVMKRGTPTGHVRLTKHMNVPVFDSGRIVLVAGVGNKKEDYDLGDVRELTLLMEGMWRLIRKKRMEEALRESEKRMADIIDLLPDPTMVISVDGIVVAWNKAMESLTNTKALDIVGKGEHEYAMPFYGQRRPLLIDYALNKNHDVLSKYNSIRLDGNVITAETIPLRLKGKDVILWARASPFYDDNGEIIGGIETVRDVTEWKRSESTLMQMNKQLNTLSDITRHDLLNTLTVLRGHVALARTRTQDEQFLKHLKVEDRLLQKVEDQIMFTKEYQNLGLAAPIWQNLAELVKKMDMPPGVALMNECDGIEIYADPMLPRVFDNLLDNSIRHGEKVTAIRVKPKRGTDGLRIIFEDNGNGIPRGNKEIIFQRGYGKNTGLGLFLVREILEITGMKIEETGVEGQGARFEVLVPRGFYRRQNEQ
ncbi:MAG: sensory histidine kinase AtoS [Methanomassiliicoccales archaeon PtaU1.Bin124]|nr:MAG: sensory histidine kinase AtoS [Methanomassiliicoccales archaeon PtaU1.Bin124]